MGNTPSSSMRGTSKDDVRLGYMDLNPYIPIGVVFSTFPCLMAKMESYRR